MNAVDVSQINRANIVLECANLPVAQEFYIQEYGFRLEMIYPADDPRVVMLGGHGIRIQLEMANSGIRETGEYEPGIIVTKRLDHSFGEGRAGMQYRDLIPNRIGGQYIASHIRIPVGGPVPDYVHHHHIQFQLIYCYKGWVRVVYEDQGPPFVMQAGDCVLQPPHIRHRVLECSDGMEVVELACPAEHETLVEYELELPNSTVDVSRKFDGQKFVFHQVDKCHWESATLPGFLQRNTGISRATLGLASAMVLRPADGTVSSSCINDQALCFGFVLRGSASLIVTGESQYLLQEGDAFVIPPGSKFNLDNITSDLELLQVTSPA